MWLILNAGQKDRMIALAREQAEPIQELARMRFPLIMAFHRQLAGEIPAKSTGLDREAVKNYSAGMFEYDGTLAFRRAQMFGEVARSMDARQKAAFSRLVFGQSNTWPVMEEQIDKRGFSHEEHVALMTYASEFFRGAAATSPVSGMKLGGTSPGDQSPPPTRLARALSRPISTMRGSASRVT